MKPSLVPLIAGLVWTPASMAQGQAYPSADAGWCIGIGASPPNGGWYFMDMPVSPDTVINGTVYQKVDWYIDTEAYPFQWIGANYVRSAPDGKGYMYWPDSLAEVMTIDLGAGVGDTVFNVFAYDETSNCPWGSTYYGSLDVVVTAIDTFSNQGVVAIRHTVLPLNCTELIGPYFWQEGLGTSEGIITGITSGLSPVNLVFGTVRDTCRYNGPPTPYSLLGGPSCCSISPAGVAENGAKGLSVSPNPTTGVFTLSFARPIPIDSYYSVYDAMGRLLYQRPLPAGATLQEIDLSRFGKGTYLIKLTDPQGVRHERVVLE